MMIEIEVTTVSGNKARFILEPQTKQEFNKLFNTISNWTKESILKFNNTLYNPSLIECIMVLNMQSKPIK